MGRRQPLEDDLIKEAIWRASAGFLRGSDRSNLHLEQLSWLLCEEWPRVVGCSSRGVRSAKCEKDPNSALLPDTPIRSGWREAKVKRGPAGDPVVVQLGGESILDRNGGTQKDVGDVLEIKVTRFGN